MHSCSQTGILVTTSRPKPLKYLLSLYIHLSPLLIEHLYIILFTASIGSAGKEIQQTTCILTLRRYSGHDRNLWKWFSRFTFEPSSEPAPLFCSRITAWTLVLRYQKSSQNHNKPLPVGPNTTRDRIDERLVLYSTGDSYLRVLHAGPPSWNTGT
jgi:hypothetical protein